MPLLEDIVMEANEVSEIPDWVGKLPAIRNLSFTGCQIKKLPENLDGWERLTTLSLSNCGIAPDDMARLRSAMPKTSILF